MSDTPIYDSIGQHRLRRSVKTADHWLVTVPVGGAVRDALTEFNHRHVVELTTALAPFGLHPHDLAQPDYRRLVYRDELTGGTE